MSYARVMSLDAEATAAIAKALAHPARVQIVELLANQSRCRGAEVFSGLPLAQSTVSEHLRVLKEAGIVDTTPSGNATVYCLRYGALDRFAADMAAIAGIIALEECADPCATAADGCDAGADSAPLTDSGEGACS